MHDHGLGRHSHALPEGAPLSPRGLIALALAGGILPAPSALLVMLGAINAHRVGYGLALVLAFSIGLATALIVIGMGALKARDVMHARLSSTMGRLVPVLSAVAIVAVGVFLTAPRDRADLAQAATRRGLGGLPAIGTGGRGFRPGGLHRDPDVVVAAGVERNGQDHLAVLGPEVGDERGRRRRRPTRGDRPSPRGGSRAAVPIT